MSNKLISLLLAICMLFCLSACGTTETSSNPANTLSESQTDKQSSTDETTSTQSENSQVSSNTEESDKNDTAQTQPSAHQSTPSNTTSQPAHTHKYADATCTSPKKCSCGATKGYAIGHEYQDGVCCVCGIVDEEQILSEIEEETTYLDMIKSWLKDEESLLETFEVGLQIAQEDLDSAVIKLEKAKSQKTMRVYYEGIGWVWEADPERVELAQSEVDSCTYLVNSKQSLVDSCNEKIKKYKNLIEKTEIKIKELKNKL